MLVIEIKSAQVESMPIRGKQGKPDWEKKFQYGFIELNGERRRLQIPVRDGAAPYQPGMYVVADASYRVNDYSALELNRFELKLDPVKPKQAA